MLSRRLMRISCFTRGTGEDTDRTISAQRLVNYRGSWYAQVLGPPALRAAVLAQARTVVSRHAKA